jgi:energy-coupling factor transporter ATP-binding protein EcfA2
MPSASICSARKAEGYQMLKELEIRNYRCFDHLTLRDFGRINFLVGRSGSGKSAFLEAIFLASGISPEIYLRIRQFRGLPAAGIEVGDRDGYESLWRDLFFKFRQEDPVYISMKDNRTGLRWVSISYGEGLPLTIKLNEPDTVIDQSPLSAPKPITFEWFHSNRTFKTQVTVTKDGLKMDTFDEVYAAIYFFPGVFQAKDNAKRFSTLSKQNREGSVIESVRNLFPNIQDLSIETIGGQPVLYASIASLPEKIPVSVLSGGINKYMAILIGICVNENGAILVDELEDGFYYYDYKNVMRSLVDACEKHRVQMFASSHSYEFLQAVVPAMTDRENDFRIFRFSNDDGVTKIKTFEGKYYKSAIEQDIEIR